MEKSFGEIFKESFVVLKKSLPDFLKIIGICIFGSVLIIGAAIAVLGMQFIKNFNDAAFVQSYMSTSSASIGLFMLFAFLLLIALYYVGYCFTVLTVRNNYLEYKEPFKETFFKSFGKCLRVFLAAIFIGIFYFLIIGVTFGIPFIFFIVKQSIWPLVAGIVLTGIVSVIILPPFYTGFFGVLCRDEDFFSVLKESVRLGFQRWFKIVGYMALITLICSVPVGFLLGLIMYILKLAQLPILENIVVFAVQIAVGLFSTCFTTILYLDISGIRQPEVVMEPIQPLENKPL